MTPSPSSTEAVYYLTPAEVCQRWRIDARTLAKVDLPWVYITPRLRRISVSVVRRIETEKGYRRGSTS
jgi:hypothetical protein